ncbi:MAG: geranylgeranylglyceryl/heptaprenylglyceryl phosphate synthase [Nanoarchaeota archaeon]|nr:geranylgeranylglyceryl/heptaprenylglyceryl phosphate synthase [Nanoarchaeota archaeon]
MEEFDVEKKPKIGKVEKYINDIIASNRGVFMGLIDPDKQNPEDAVKLAKIMNEGGADVIMLGGSIGAQGHTLDETAKMIKESTNIPLHLFPGNVSNVTEYANSIYFMSLLNSKNPYWISGAQVLAAPVVKQYDIEVMPTGYIVFEPGQTVGHVGEAQLLTKEKPDLAVAYSLAAQYMGMRFVILESGSGAPSPVPLHIVSAVNKVCDLNIVVAGGVKTPEQARELILSGANCIHIGTKIEESSNPLERVRKFARAIHLMD